MQKIMPQRDHAPLSMPRAIGSPEAGYHQQLRDEKRTAALDAAMKLFLKQGYERTSLLQVAKEAGLSTSTLFKHFPTKTALFKAIVTKYWELDEPYRYQPEVGNPAAGLRKIADDYACLLSRPEMTALFRVVVAEASQLPEIGRAQFDEGQRPFLESLQQYLRAEVNAGTLHVPNVRLAAEHFLALIAGAVLWPGLLLSDFKPSAKDLQAAVHEAVQMMLARYHA
jgi:TetR/AcrR family transcriptional regulator, regulator of autoinduction and epiphytic fitness